MTGTQRQTTIEQVVEDYFAMWNELDPEKRREIIAGSWAAEVSYKDPMVAAGSQDELVVMVDGVHQQFPEHRFALVGEIDAYQDRARWGWELAGPNGVIATGVDFAVLTPEGRLREVTGFINQ